MMNPQKTEVELSPLDQIRQTEAEVTRQVAAARERAETIISEARSQAGVIIEEARAAGRREGLTRYQEIVAAAQEEAQATIAKAYKRVEILQLREQRRMSAGLRHAVNMVIGIDRDGESG